MKKSKKITIVAAAITVAAGLIISFGAMCAMGFDFRKMNTVSFTVNTYQVDEDFSGISVEGAESDIRLLPSEDGSCRVVCNESDKIYHSVSVKDGVLTVTRTDTRKWYEHIGIYWGRMEITVYLPGNEYESVYVKSLSGNITVPKDFTFGDADIRNTSGNVNFSADVKNGLSAETVSGDVYVVNTAPKDLSVKSTSGDVKLSSVKTGGELKIKTVSGDIELGGAECQNITAESTSGDTEFSMAYASEKISIQSVSGEVELHGCDGDSVWIKTVSGDVSGSFLTEKVFITDTQSGDVEVPVSSTGGKCEIKTTSGDIEFDGK